MANFSSGFRKERGAAARMTPYQDSVLGSGFSKMYY